MKTIAFACALISSWKELAKIGKKTLWWLFCKFLNVQQTCEQISVKDNKRTRPHNLTSCYGIESSGKKAGFGNIIPLKCRHHKIAAWGNHISTHSNLRRNAFPFASFNGAVYFLSYSFFSFRRLGSFDNRLSLSPQSYTLFIYFELCIYGKIIKVNVHCIASATLADSILYLIKKKEIIVVVVVKCDKQRQITFRYQ